MPTVGSGNIQPGTGKITYPGEVSSVSGVTTTTPNETSITIVGINLNGTTGAGIFSSSSGNNTDIISLNFKNIVSGDGIALTSDNNSITITNTGTSSGSVNADWNATSGFSQILNKPVLATVATTGSYTDLTNKPVLVNADWNALTGLAQILNKPIFATVAMSGSYLDLTNTPAMPAAQVNSDWNATSGVAVIENKPVLANVAISGSYADLSNKPTIPAAQVNADWNATSGVTQILNKPTASSYQLPVASPIVLGGIKVASGLTVDGVGNLSANVVSVQGQTGAVTLTAANVGAISSSLFGVASGVATLDINGNVPMAQLPPSIVGGLNYQGTWNAITNTPAITSGSASLANKGWYFKVSTAGTTTVDGNSSWQVGDWIVSDSTIWQQIHNTETVSSVNGATGAVVVSAQSLGLSTVATSGSYADLTNKPTIPSNTSQLTNGAGFITTANLSTYAPLANPAFTGVPTAPSPIVGSNNTQIATTAFVASSITAAATGVASFNTRTGAITLTSSDVTTALGFVPVNPTALTPYATLASPALTGVPVAPTASAGTSTTQLATTAFVTSAILTVTSASVASFNTRTGAITLTSGDITTALGFTPANASTTAPLASPVLTGIPIAPTATAGTNTTQLATTAFVTSAISTVTSVSVASFNTRTGAITLQSTDVTTALGFTPVNPTALSTYAPLASPALTGSPTAPTATLGNSSTQIATTAFVAANSITANSPTIASPTLTSRSNIAAMSHGVTTLGSVSGTQTLNLASATEWTATITGNTTFAFSNTPVTNASQVVILRLTNAGAFTIAWPASTQFVGAVAPTFTAAGVDVVGVKYDTVTSNYMVFVIGLNVH